MDFMANYLQHFAKPEHSFQVLRGSTILQKYPLNQVGFFKKNDILPHLFYPGQ
jgi:hypothetical protein